VATLYSVTCTGEFSGGVIVKLRDLGMYRVAVAGEGRPRHELQVEAGSPDDAILRARGAVAVAGGQGFDYRAVPAAG
jgi:hypothetical protein